MLREGLSNICVKFRHLLPWAFLYKAVVTMSRKDRPRNAGSFQGREETANPSRNPLANSDWQILCELVLRVFNHAEQTVHSWLTECLELLDLQEDVVDRLLRSAQGAVARTVGAEVGSRPEYIEILLFVPPDHELKGQTWGFFRVEKIVDARQDAVSHGQTIAFYLYLEGQ
jgi:hypothetical protein